MVISRNPVHPLHNQQEPVKLAYQRVCLERLCASGNRYRGIFELQQELFGPIQEHMNVIADRAGFQSTASQWETICKKALIYVNGLRRQTYLQDPLISRSTLCKTGAILPIDMIFEDT